jgi:hypothetical protein
MLVSIEQYQNELQKDIIGFIKFWKQQNLVNPKDFPLEMFTGDFDEQFDIWRDQYSKLELKRPVKQNAYNER